MREFDETDYTGTDARSHQLLSHNPSNSPATSIGFTVNLMATH